MEIYILYDAIKTTFDVMRVTPGSLTRIYSLIGGVSIWLVLFLLQGFGLYAMGKKKHLKKGWMAFVPFVNILYIGRLVGEFKIFNNRVKRAGMYAMIGQIVVTIVCALLIASELYLYIEVGEPTKMLYQDYYYVLDWQTTGFAAKVEEFLGLGAAILSILQLIYEILMFIMLITLFRNYSPKRHMLLTLLSIFIPLSRYVIIFVIRNNKAVDYNAYMRAQREAFMRRQQAQYGTPNVNPYGAPFSQPTRPTPPTSRPDDEPFAEFSSSAQTKTEEKSAKNNQDDFFNA